jgi:hypothetical protein
MKLYKQYIQGANALSDPELIMESASLLELKREAERLARLDGLDEPMWLSGNDTNPEFAFPYELHVTNDWFYSIRSW